MGWFWVTLAIIFGGWFALALLIGIVTGKSIKLADDHDAAERERWGF